MSCTSDLDIHTSNAAHRGNIPELPESPWLPYRPHTRQVPRYVTQQPTLWPLRGARLWLPRHASRALLEKLTQIGFSAATQASDNLLTRLSQAVRRAGIETRTTKPMRPTPCWAQTRRLVTKSPGGTRPAWPCRPPPYAACCPMPASHERRCRRHSPHSLGELHPCPPPLYQR